MDGGGWSARDEMRKERDRLKAKNADLLLALGDLVNYGPHISPVRHDSILRIIAKAKEEAGDETE